MRVGGQIRFRAALNLGTAGYSTGVHAVEEKIVVIRGRTPDRPALVWSLE
jgi:hypothetical protein